MTSDYSNIITAKINRRMCSIVLGRENYLRSSYVCLLLKPRLCDVLACRPYSVGRRMTARQSIASNPLYLLLQ